MDLPLITEATNEYYRNIYADPLLGPIFRGINMVVLRQHVSYFIHQLTMFDQPMSTRQYEYLRKVHLPVIQKHGVTQQHYDLMVSYLVEAMRTNGAQEEHLVLVQAKLQPLRDLFPASNSSVDGAMVLDEQQQLQQQQRQQQHANDDQASSSYGQQDEQGEKQQQAAMHGTGKFKAWAKRLVRRLSSKQ